MLLALCVFKYIHVKLSFEVANFIWLTVKLLPLALLLLIYLLFLRIFECKLECLHLGLL